MSLSLYYLLQFVIHHIYMYVLSSIHIIVILVLVNCYSVRLTALVSMVFSGLKLLAVAIIVGASVVTVIVRKSLPDWLLQLFHPLEGHDPSIASVAVALYGVLWAYNGWYVMLCVYTYQCNIPPPPHGTGWKFRDLPLIKVD